MTDWGRLKGATMTTFATEMAPPATRAPGEWPDSPVPSAPESLPS